MKNTWLIAALALTGIAAFAQDAKSVITRSEIILQRPNLKPEQAMPLGNGSLGLAVWGAEGLTLQLNREDTFPGRLSPGQVAFPTLQRINAASDYAGHLDLYNGEFAASGNGITATVYVEPATDVTIVDVRISI